jgi:diguanylate cyclase (GGDEF)-like protein
MTKSNAHFRALDAFTPAVDQGAYEAALAGNAYTLGLPGAVEREYRASDEARRRKEMVRATLFGIAMYVALLWADYLLLPDVFATALVVRLFLVAPVALAAIALGRRLGDLGFELSLAAASVIVGLSIAALAVTSTSQGRTYYHFGLVEVIMFMAIVQRLRIGVAVLAVGTVWAMHLAVVASIPEIDLRTALASNALVLTSAVFSLVALASLEHRERTGFLLRRIDAARRDELAAMAYRDTLTGLSNRAAFHQYVESLERSVLLVDVDHFKRYNDHYGHHAGDECLQAVAGVLSGFNREGRLVARYGGEEFIVIAPDLGSEAAANLAARIVDATRTLAIPHDGKDPRGVVTLSVGVALAQRTSRDCIHEAIRLADSALYEAKREGRDGYRIQLLDQTAKPADLAA